MKRPHTLLLMATSHNGIAVRGKYTGAIAEQVKLADETTHIIDIHEKAAASICGRSPLNQMPSFHSTLSKKIYLGKRFIPNKDSGDSKLSDGIGDI